jgi:predicted Zn-dependent protease
MFSRRKKMGTSDHLSIEKDAPGFAGLSACIAMSLNSEIRISLVTKPLPRKLAFAVLALTLWIPLFSAGQSQTGNTPGTSAPGWPISNTLPGHGRVIPDPTTGMESPGADGTDESCSLWNVSVLHGSTVSTARLQVPAKAKGEYKKACSDLKDGKLPSAEEHLRKGVQEYPQYAAAWVLLGQVLETATSMEGARDACSRASSLDTNYAPAYLCLADVAAQQKEWDQTLDLATRALALSPVDDVYGYFYSAIAHFHLSQLPAAEKEAQQAIDTDRAHRVPQVHLLLAQIYMAKHDNIDAAAHLRAYLKIDPGSPVAAGVKKSLAELESQTAK